MKQRALFFICFSSILLSSPFLVSAKDSCKKTFQPLKNNIQVVDLIAPDAGQRIMESFRNTGFAVLSNHSISKKEIDKFYQAWEQFFKQSEEKKQELLFSEDNLSGFFPFAQEHAKDSNINDLKEFFHYYPTWGHKPKGKLKKITQDLYSKLNDTAYTIISLIQKELPKEVTNQMSEPLTDMIKGSEQSLLRILHYPPIDKEIEPGAVRAAEHQDINLLTLLITGSEPGLQVKTKDGQWIDVPYDPKTIVMNIGDALQLATKNYLPSTSHRVVNPEGAKKNTSRLSVPLFFHARGDAVLDPKTGLTALGYLEERQKEIWKKKYKR